MRQPPALAEQVLSHAAADPGLCDAVLGDLVEEYRARCASDGEAAATRWYWRAAGASLGPLAIAALRRANPRSWALGTLATAAGCGAFAAVVSLSEVVLRNLLIVPAISGELLPIILVIIAGAWYGMFAGWLAGTVARQTSLASSAALGVVILGLNGSALHRGLAVGPLWYWLGFGVAACSGAWAGGLLRLYSTRSHRR